MPTEAFVHRGMQYENTRIYAKDTKFTKVSN